MSNMDFKKQTYLVVGLGKSGMGAIRALRKSGAVVWAYDQKGLNQLDEHVKEELAGLGVTLFAGHYPQISQGHLAAVILSPGVAKDTEIIKYAAGLGIPVIGEVELAYLIKRPLVDFLAVTGTNGKTTTTSLLQHLLEQAGIYAVLGGNIGIPLSSQVELMECGVVCIEMSSFQLETIEHFRACIAAVLNITPDHLDRHKTMEAYIRAKERIFKNMEQNDYLVLNDADPLVQAMALKSQARVMFFSAQGTLDQGVYIEDGHIVVSWEDMKQKVASLDKLSLRGNHNRENILCAVAIAYLYGVTTEDITLALQTFKAVRHRMEEAGVRNGVLYINDSKATNPESSIKALESFPEPIVLIAGGRGKGADFTFWAGRVAEKVKALIIFGEDKVRIKTAVMNAGFSNIYEVDDLIQAFHEANFLAEPGDVVLLSPACASWDMFISYEERGDLFCSLVKALDSAI